MSTAQFSAVAFDLGNTLLHLDYEFVAGFLRGHGHAVVPQAIRRAEYAARAALDREVAPVAGGAPPNGDGARVGYFATVLDALGVSMAGREALLGALQEHHRASNLWRVLDDDATAVLEELRARGFLLAVISNADGRVEADLERSGLRRHFAAVIDSHVVGVEKPDPAIFRLALDRLGVAPAHAMHVGDIFGIDVLGARAAGMAAVLVDGLGEYPGAVDCPRVRRLSELLALLPEQAGR